MKTFFLPYHTSQLTLEIPDDCSVTEYFPPVGQEPDDSLTQVRKAIASPLGRMVQRISSSACTAAIAINDKTRPVPHQFLLPPLLEYLQILGILPERTEIIIASGTHIPMTKDEFGKVLPGNILSKYRVFAHDCDDSSNLVPVGITSRGTQIEMNRQFMAADLRIVVGNIEPHHFQGFSGGVKSAAIGLGGRETITQNHSWLPDPQCRTTEFTRNPMRQDTEEIGRMIGVHLALNAVLNSEKKIVEVFFGDPSLVMQEGMKTSKIVCQVPVREQYDLVFASAGGYPKDINLYQAQKAVTNACLFLREGGIVVLSAACSEGIGSRTFEEFMTGIRTPEEVMQKFLSAKFQIGPHKAFLFARQLINHRIVLVSEIPPAKVQQLLIQPADNLSMALNYALEFLPPNPKVAILPKATLTIPSYKGV